MELNLRKYKYTHDWFVGSEIRKNLLNHVKKSEQITMLEIGCFEGLSSCCFSDNLLSHRDSTLDCVDPFIKSGTDPEITSQFINEETKRKFLHNISKSKNHQKGHISP